MSLRRREVELSVERGLGPGGDPGGGVVRLTARFDVADRPDGPTSEELQESLDRLRAELDRLAPARVRTDRPVEELIETYRPRQPELIELLREEGELTPAEFDRLKAHFAGAPLAPTRSPAPPPTPAAPAPGRPAPPNERPVSGARSVDELLRQYRIESLRQAGVVRARREISFDEYMALKRHFEASPPSSG